MESKFSLTTAQAAHRLGVKQHVLIKHFNVHGNYKGIVPRKQPNGRWLCPRDQVLKAASLRPDGSASTVPANAAVSFFEEKNLDCSDPILQEALIHLHATEADSSHGAAHLFTEAAMVGSLIAAFVARLNSAEGGHDEA